MVENRHEQGISILICTYNGANRLPQTLQALINQKNTEGIPWEVIVVNNASTDNTTEVAYEQWKDISIPFRVIDEPQPGRDNALRTGFTQVKYEFVCNVDDDTWVCEDYVSLVWKTMPAHPEVAVCGGHGSGEFEIEPPAWLKPLESSLAIGPQGTQQGYVSEDRNFLYGACAVYRKSLWEALHNSGFQFFLSGRKGKKLNSGEDLELCMAWMLMGYKLWYDPKITFKHYMPAGRLTWTYFRKLYKAFGRSDLIAYQYQTALGMYSSNSSFMMSKHCLVIVHTLIQIVKEIPQYIFAVIFKNEGNLRILHLERNFSLLFELLLNRKRYLAIRKALAQASWIKNNP